MVLELPGTQNLPILNKKLNLKIAKQKKNAVNSPCMAYVLEGFCQGSQAPGPPNLIRCLYEFETTN